MTGKKLVNLIFFFFTSIILIAQNPEMDPDAAKLFNDGNSLRNSGDFSGAVKKYNDALNISKNYKIFYQLGLTYKDMKKYSEAIDAYQKSLDSNPGFATAHYAMGSVYYTGQQFDKAIEAFTKYRNVETNAKNKKSAEKLIATSYVQLGAAAKKDGKYDKAIELYQEAVKIFPLDRAYISMAEAYNELGKYDLSLQAADNANNNRDKVSKGEVAYYKGLAFRGKGDIEKAKESFQQGLSDSRFGELCKYQLNLTK